MDYSGFVCEIGQDSFKVYDFVHKLVEIDNKDVSGSQQIALGIWLENGDPSTEAFKIDVIDDVVTLKTTALRPNVAALPKAHLREKYRNVVWSPWLQNLHDPKKLFYLCRAEDPVMATVKYAPKDEFLFEVISIEPADDVELTPHNFTDAPWHVETRMDYVRMPMIDENLPIETEFIFDHDMLESRENREVEDATRRFSRLSKSAHFVDPQLGKVEIYSEVSQAIIQAVERRTPDEVELRKEDALVVLVRVKLLRRWLTNFTDDALFAVFEVAELVDIRYFSDAMSIMAAVAGDV